MKKILIIAVAVVIVITIALLITSTYFNRHPNEIVVKTAVNINEGKTETVKYDYGHLIVLTNKKIPVYKFTPSETSEYVFEVRNFSSSTDEMLVMSVLDKSLSELTGEDNISDEDGTFTDTVSDAEFLQKGREYYIVIDVASSDSKSQHSGSFDLTVTKSEELKPTEITEEHDVTLNVKRREHSTVSFTPPETGYYRFDTEIVSENASTGYSVINEITTAATEKEKKITSYDGICYLDAGSEYYIEVGVEDIKGSSAKVKVSCKNIGVTGFDESGSAVLDKDSIIEYTADKNASMLLYSISKGDPEATVYDKKGFPMRTDDDSGEDFGGGAEDFALIINAKKGETYWIYVAGELKECTVMITEYTDPDPESETEGENTAEETSEESAANTQ